MPLFNPPTAGSGTFASDIVAQAHIRSTAGTAPTVVNGAGNGTGAATPTVAGTDAAGSVTFGTGTTGMTNNSMVTVTFATAYSGTSVVVVITPQSNHSSQYKPYVILSTSGGNTTGFTIWFASVPIASDSYTYSYHVIG